MALLPPTSSGIIGKYISICPVKHYKHIVLQNCFLNHSGEENEKKYALTLLPFMITQLPLPMLFFCGFNLPYRITYFQPEEFD